MFDAYTIKKVVPRLVAAIILIQLSWFIFTTMLRITNDIAFGIEGLMYAPFGGKDGLNLTALINGLAGSSPGGTGTAHGLFTAMVVLGAGASLFAMTAFGVLSLALSVLLGAMIAMIVLVLRRAIIVALLVISPIALVAWILPGTEKYWKLWWESFSKLLMLFPMILLIIAAGRVLAFVSLGNGAHGGITESTASGVAEWVIVIVCYFGPYFLIPKTFSMAGSAFSSLAGMANDRSRGVFDRLRKGRQNMAKQAWQDNKNFTRFKNKRFDKLNTAIGYAANGNRAGINPTKWRGRLSAVKSDNSIAQAAAMQEDADYASWKGNDDLNGIASQSRNEADLRRRLAASGLYTGPNGRANMERDVARVESMRRKYGNSAFRQATHLSAVSGGTYFDNPDKAGSPNWLQAAADVSGGDDAVLASLVNKGKGAAVSAGRADQGSLSFGAAMDIAHDFQTAGGHGQTTEQGRERMLEQSFDSQGASVLAHPSMKASTITHLAPRLVRRVQEAAASGDQRQIAQALGELHNVRNQLNGTSPEKARALADGVFGQDSGLADANGNAITISRAIDAWQGTDAFGEVREVYRGVGGAGGDPPPQGPQGGNPGDPPGGPPPGQ